MYEQLTQYKYIVTIYYERSTEFNIQCLFY